MIPQNERAWKPSIGKQTTILVLLDDNRHVWIDSIILNRQTWPWGVLFHSSRSCHHAPALPFSRNMYKRKESNNWENEKAFWGQQIIMARVQYNILLLHCFYLRGASRILHTRDELPVQRLEKRFWEEKGAWWESWRLYRRWYQTRNHHHLPSSLVFVTSRHDQISRDIATVMM